ncbi:hypothetical protein [Rubellimicrobium aerolatum]|uniref:Uncharacterized protein n=1 Tax=Rubellimicrobium aerolatum TaxID=490979 RepID=A0ABW0S816_9RHOB|nr:hypothetical protein [Rubellimicrobium aerolatum]MBP1804380.1 endonuclease YncB(thermonuclease family) [Rubellimicrobium aerolatum]
MTHVRDGDTLEVAGVPVRIANLDCAELGTSDGESARLFLFDPADGQTLACDLEGRRSYDREVGTCAILDRDPDDHLGRIVFGHRDIEALLRAMEATPPGPEPVRKALSI